jgi:hypothetical protein
MPSHNELENIVQAYRTLGEALGSHLSRITSARNEVQGYSKTITANAGADYAAKYQPLIDSFIDDKSDVIKTLRDAIEKFKAGAAPGGFDPTLELQNLRGVLAPYFADAEDDAYLVAAEVLYYRVPWEQPDNVIRLRVQAREASRRDWLKA